MVQFLVKRYFSLLESINKARKQDEDKLDDRIRKIEDRVTALETKLNLYWWVTTSLLASLLFGVLSILVKLYV